VAQVQLRPVAYKPANGIDAPGRGASFRVVITGAGRLLVSYCWSACYENASQLAVKRNIGRKAPI